MKRMAALSVSIFVMRFGALAMVPYDLSEKGAFAQVRIRVVDQDGIAVSGAKIWGCFTTGSGLNDYALVDGFSDANGEYIAQNRCNERLRVDIMKDGYYRSEVKIYFGQSVAVPIVAEGKWQPYGERKTVVLKKIKKLGKLSVPDMKRAAVKEWKIPKFDCWLAFDLEKFDWNPPYGSGGHPDVLLRFRNRMTPCYYDFTYCMDVSFTNNQFAGVYVMQKDSVSDLKTVYEADPSAEFRSGFTYVCEKTGSRKSISDYLKDDGYLVFRTRTAVDEKGRLLSAHYGTILGAWKSGAEHMRIGDGCFNPIGNRTDVEDSFYLREAVRQYKGN